MLRKVMIMAFCAALAICLAAPAAHADKKFLRMFSGPEGGSWYPLGSAMMSILEKNLKDLIANFK